MAKEIVLTREGYERKKELLEELTTTRRKEVAERIAAAREFGDISENSEYDDAKNEQAMLEQQIAVLEDELREARVVEEGELESDVVSIGVWVTVKDKSSQQRFKVVGSGEGNPDEDQISIESPVGKALLGRRVGETAEIVTPGGSRSLKVVEISVS